MKPIEPSHIIKDLAKKPGTAQISEEHLKIIQSFHQVLDGQIDRGTGSYQDPNAGANKGVYTQFQPGNQNGAHIRIAANGVTGSGAAYNWGAVNVGIVINHGLLRQPIGFHIVDMDKDVRIYRTVPPDKNQITLAPTDNTASVTLWIY